MVEAALTVLIFFTLVFVTIEFGRALNVYHTITDAAREGARYAVAPFPGTTNYPTAGQVQSFAQNYLNAAAVKGAKVSVSTLTQPVDGVNTTFTQVQITAPYNFTALPFLGKLNLSTTSVMRNEQ